MSWKNWKRTLYNIIVKPTEIHDETVGSNRFRDTNKLVNEVAKTDKKAATKIALDAAKQRGVETAAMAAVAAAPHILPVIANPATASTTAGAVAATGLDASGLAMGLNQLNNYWNNRKNLTWKDTPGILLSGLSLVPGSSQLTSPRNLNIATNTIRNLNPAFKYRSLLERVKVNPELAPYYNDAASAKIKVTLKNDGTYNPDTHTVTLPLFGNKRTIAHEMGHAALRGGEIDVPNYDYTGTGLNRGNEAAADWFAGNLNERYYGKNAVMQARQNAVDNFDIIRHSLADGTLRFGEPATYNGVHQSSKSIQQFEFPYQRWDVINHGADPNGAFFTLDKPAEAGFLAKRPYTSYWEIKSQKPLIQTGEIRGPGNTKNNVRNAIVDYARRNGADAVEFRGIADNNLKNQNVLFATDKSGIRFKYESPVTEEISLVPQNEFMSTKQVASGSRPISEFEKNGKYTLDELHQMGFKLPRKHLQGDDAVKMFKEYGTSEIPENSQLIQQLRKYVPEARERYGLVGNTNISDEEIAGSLYKKVLELGGDTAARNEIGEPLVLFRGDTKRYLALKPRISPEKLVNRSGTMDNGLGTLFLDDFGKPVLTHGGGPERYLTGWDYITDSWNYRGGGAGEPYNHLLSEIDRNTPSGILWGLKPATNSKYGHLVGFIKAPSKSTVSGANDLNAFVVRTPKVRNATNEIAILNENEDALLRGYWGSTPHHSGKLYTNVNGQERWRIGEESIGASKAPRKLLAEHFENVLNDAKVNKEGLIMSEPGAVLRDEHQAYGYYALPNFNIRGAKHILPFDLRTPTQWNSRIIYRNRGGILKGQNGIPEINGGELQPVIVKPAPVKIVLRTDPITKHTPITHSSLRAPDFFVSKGSDDPTYNFLKANCSDATGEVLELFTGQDFTSGITTPIGVSRKVRKIYGSKPGYSERKMTSRYQEFEVPWYDYRRAKDLINYNTLQTILNKYNPKPNVKANIIANWAKERPTLPYYLDEDNNVHYYKE